MDGEASKHMTCDRKIFNRFQVQEEGLRVELGDVSTYIVTGLGIITF